MSNIRFVSKWFRDSGRRGAPRPPRPAPARLALETLGERVLPAVTATFSAADGTLRVVGDALDNTVVVSRDAAGTILVNAGTVAILGGPATVAATRLIFLNGGAGNDNLSLNEANGPMPAASISGGDGNDVLTGGSGNDFADGGAGNDTILLGAGDDTFVWNPGDGSDVIEGQGGRDTTVFNGSDVAEKFDISDLGTGSPFHRVRLTRDVGNVTMDLHGVETIDLNPFGGADTVTVNDLTATDIFDVNLDLNGSAGTGDGQPDAVIINGTIGDDFGQVESFGTRITANVSFFPFVNITGEDGLDALMVNTLGGNDVLDASDLAATNASQLVKLAVNGGTGNDALTGSQGFDTFVWNPGDGNDTIEGGDGEDTLIVNGSDLSERFDLSANGTRARFTRDVGSVTTDFGGVEEIDLNPLGGADAITVNDLSTTPATEIVLNLAGAAGGAAGDGQADSIIVNGRSAADSIPVIGHNGVIAVDGGFPDSSGLPYFTVIRAVEAADALRINGNGGDDTIDAGDLETPVTFIADGGAGNDTIFGSRSNDQVTGGAGNDTAFLGAGDDTFVWNPGDGSDVVEGQDGNDLLTFNGSDVAETFVIARNGSRVRLARDVGIVTMDVNGFEGIDLHALGGADTVAVNDLTGTGLVKVQLGLNGPAGGGDGQADTITVNGTNGDDAIRLAAAGNTILVDGLFPLVRITGSDGVTDHLTVNALGGNDTVDAANLPANLIGLTVDLGDGQATPRVAGVAVNSGAAQRSMVTQVQVAFDRHVALLDNAADAFRLVRQRDGAVVTLRAAVDDTGAGTVVTLTFTGGAADGPSLADGRYMLTVLAGRVAGPGGALDGDGDGLAGGDFVLAGGPANGLFRLFGDATGDGAVDNADFFRFKQTFLRPSTDPLFLSALDFDGSGVVDNADFFQFKTRFGTTV